MVRNNETKSHATAPLTFSFYNNGRYAQNLSGYIVTLLNGVTVGSGVNQREGRKIFVTGIEIRS